MDLSRLKASNVWYGHSLSVTWIQPSLPEGLAVNTYEESGWCFVEASISSVPLPARGPARDAIRTRDRQQAAEQRQLQRSKRRRGLET